MGLICNGHLFGHCPHSFKGSVATMYFSHGYRDKCLSGRNRNITAGEGITSDNVGVPMGYLPPAAWIMPQKPGNLSSHNEARGLATAILALVSGRNISGASTGEATTAASLTLVVALSGLAAGSCSALATLIAILEMSGSADGSCTVTAAKNAIAWCVGSASGAATAALTSYATGALSGHIYVNEGTASVSQLVDGVWDALATDHDSPGTMGEKVSAAGSAGDPWTTDLPGSYTGNQAGNIIGKKLLSTAKFLGIK